MYLQQTVLPQAQEELQGLRPANTRRYRAASISRHHDRTSIDALATSNLPMRRVRLSSLAAGLARDAMLTDAQERHRMCESASPPNAQGLFHLAAALPCEPGDPKRGKADVQRQANHQASCARPARCPKRRSLATSCRRYPCEQTGLQRFPYRLSHLSRKKTGVVVTSLPSTHTKPAEHGVRGLNFDQFHAKRLHRLYLDALHIRSKGLFVHLRRAHGD